MDVYWQPDDPGMHRNGPPYSLPYPPRGIRAELETFLRIESIRGLQETKVALLDEIGQDDSAVLVIPRNNSHYTCIRCNEFPLRDERSESEERVGMMGENYSGG